MISTADWRVLMYDVTYRGYLESPAEARCNAIGQCAQVWCPGQPLPVGGWGMEPTVKWDMNVCHTWYNGNAGRVGSTNGQVEVGWRIMEGEPSPVPGLY